MDSTKFDAIVIGAGPAGLTAAIYLSRDMLKTIVIEKMQAGGLPVTTHLIENYPAFPDGVTGKELMALMKRQALRFGAKIAEYDEAVGIERLPDGDFRVKTRDGGFIGKSVIVATGSVPKKLGIPGEEEFRGKGVSYCAICDGSFFRDMDVAVIGMGNSGLQEGAILLELCRNVTFIEFLPFVPAEKILFDRISGEKNVEFLLNRRLLSINGGQFVESLTVENRETGEKSDIPVSGVFVYAGYAPNSGFIENIAELDERGYIVSNEKMETGVPGLFVAGDVRSKQVQQITVACGDGTIAAINASEYIRGLKV